jgi:hypothetical protein
LNNLERLIFQQEYLLTHSTGPQGLHPSEGGDGQKASPASEHVLV